MRYVYLFDYSCIFPVGNGVIGDQFVLNALNDNANIKLKNIQGFVSSFFLGGIGKSDIQG